MTLTEAQIVEALFAKNIFTKTESGRTIDTLFRTDQAVPAKRRMGCVEGSSARF
jgi:hypothetical protein